MSDRAAGRLDGEVRWGGRARVVAAAGVGLAGLTLICAMLLIWNDRQAHIVSWNQNLTNVSGTLAAHADQTLRAADLVLESVQELVRSTRMQGRDDLAQVMGTRAIHDSLRDRVGHIPQVDVVTVMALDGGVVNFTRSYPPPPINLADRDFFKAILGPSRPAFFLSGPVRNRGTGSWVFYLARPIPGPDGEPIGVVVAGIANSFFSDFYKAMRFGDNSAISLFRDDGVLLAREPMRDTMLGRSFQDNPVFQHMRDAAETAQVYTEHLPRLQPAVDDFPRVIAPHRLAGFPVFGSITVPEAVTLAGWRHTARNVALLTFGLVAAMLSLTFMLARLFNRQDRTMQDLLAARLQAEDAAASRGVLLEELRANEAKLTEQSEVLKATLENIDQGLMMVAADGTVPVCNRRASELLDLSPALMATRPLFRAVVDQQQSAGEFAGASVQLAHVLGTAVVMTQAQTYERTRPNGTILEVQTIPLPAGGMVRTFTDITARRRSEEQIRYFAHHDGLTELINRMVFEQRLAEAIPEALRSDTGLAVHYLDLDGFKLVNDTHGHGVGDRLLVEVADRLRRAVRGPDTVARMGGDEFAIIQLLTGSPGAVAQLASRILSVVSEPYAIGGLRCSVGLSIGVALFPEHASSAEGLLRDADVALYRAKANGKGTVCVFDAAMDRGQRSAFQLESDLMQAMDRGEFFLEYQPIVDPATRAIESYEALVRWRHPEHGVIPPGVFIGMAERTGLIVALGAWVLETACHAAMRLAPEIGLAVNVSPVQFSRGDLPAQVRNALDRSGLAARRLTLEVTEGVLLEETDVVLQAMATLRGQGVRFSLDDFGTAHSRLTYLQRFPFDIIKIDRSFVADAVGQDGARAIVAAVLAIGLAFRLSVVAEGVEDEGQLDLLRSMGCGLVQGYLTGRPGSLVPDLRNAQQGSIEAGVA